MFESERQAEKRQAMFMNRGVGEKAAKNLQSEREARSTERVNSF